MQYSRFKDYISYDDDDDDDDDFRLVLISLSFLPNTRAIFEIQRLYFVTKYII